MYMMNIMIVLSVLNIKCEIREQQTEMDTEDTKAIQKYVKIVPPDIYAQNQRIV